MSATKRVLIAASVACMAFYSSEGYSAQSILMSETAKLTRSNGLRPIRVHGQAHVRLNADIMSVNMSMTAVADTMEKIIISLKNRRQELSGKTDSGSLNVIRTELSSLRINKQGGNSPSYRGEVQITVEFTGFEDPLDAIAELANDKVNRVGSLRFGFSKELLKENDLCDIALTNAREKAAKQAEATGHKLGKLIDHQCNWSYRQAQHFSSQPTRQFSTSANATFERSE